MTTPGPKFLLCYICRGKFVEASLKIHEPQCLQKWTQENNSLPKHQRQLLPKKPEAAQLAGELVPCGRCGRTFASERLPVHQKVCKGGKQHLLKTNATVVQKTKPTSDSVPPTTQITQSPRSSNGAAPHTGNHFGRTLVRTRQCRSMQ